ncbi:hypothetical protein NC99_01450 [Sunxiuqinia dokdonensis]|uniref:Uncharacterized protein n=1 Tax=Sunxiuqinia dokdonensis TaxID=1409788 RepID=A0A0L8VEW0_9BACT|nr:hypothetical protein NC99_01450 [Sunxiuqinia dokdonensis]
MIRAKNEQERLSLRWRPFLFPLEKSKSTIRPVILTVEKLRIAEALKPP